MAFSFRNNRIGKLPGELLEKILLDVIDDEAPQLEQSSYDESILLCLQEVEAVSISLTFRATCVTFRNLSWRACAKVIDCTVFDLASRKSVHNLEAICNTRQLTPWVSRLNVAFHVIRHSYP